MDVPAPQNLKKAYAYSTKYALCMEESYTRKKQPTVMFSAAKKSNPTSNEYDWSNALHLQLTVQELPQVAAVFMGELVECHFTNHQHKSIKISNQQANLFVYIDDRKRGGCAIPIVPFDAFYFTGLLLAQLSQHFPNGAGGGCTSLALRAMLTRVQSIPPKKTPSIA